MNVPMVEIEVFRLRIVGLFPRGKRFQKISMARAEPWPNRGFGNSFKQAIDVPPLESH